MNFALLRVLRAALSLASACGGWFGKRTRLVLLACLCVGADAAVYIYAPASDGATVTWRKKLGSEWQAWETTTWTLTAVNPPHLPAGTYHYAWIANDSIPEVEGPSGVTGWWQISEVGYTGSPNYAGWWYPVGGGTPVPWKISRTICNGTAYRQALVYQFADWGSQLVENLAPGACFTITREVEAGADKPQLSYQLVGSPSGGTSMQDMVVTEAGVSDAWEETATAPVGSTSTATGYAGPAVAPVTGATGSSAENDAKMAGVIRDGVTESGRNVVNAVAGVGESIKDALSGAGFQNWRAENAAGFNFQSNRLQEIEAQRVLDRTKAEVLTDPAAMASKSAEDQAAGVAAGASARGALEGAGNSLGAGLGNMRDGLPGVGILETLDLSVSFGNLAGTDYSVDLNPAHSPMWTQFASWSRVVLTWVAFATFAWLNLGVIREMVRDYAGINPLPAPPESQAGGSIPFLGATAGRLKLWITAGIVVGGFVVALGGIVALAFTGLPANLGVASVYSAGGTSVATAFALVVFFVPLASIITQAALHVAVRTYADSALILASSYIRML